MEEEPQPIAALSSTALIIGILSFAAFAEQISLLSGWARGFSNEIPDLDSTSVLLGGPSS